MSEMKNRAEEILDGITDPKTLKMALKVQEILRAPAEDVLSDTDKLNKLIEKVAFLETVTVANTARLLTIEKNNKEIRKILKEEEERMNRYYKNTSLIHERMDRIELQAQEHAAYFEAISFGVTTHDKAIKRINELLDVADPMAKADGEKA
jgi:hypothetical protein